MVRKHLRKGSGGKTLTQNAQISRESEESAQNPAKSNRNLLRVLKNIAESIYLSNATQKTQFLKSSLGFSLRRYLFHYCGVLSGYLAIVISPMRQKLTISAIHARLDPPGRSPRCLAHLSSDDGHIRLLHMPISGRV
jgi:hypothetical protein